MTNAVAIAQQGSNNTTFRNRIINGAMVFDQRYAGASTTATSGTTYSLDRWQNANNVYSKYSFQRVSDAPAGFTYSLKATSLSAYSIGSTEVSGFRQYIEGYNVADLGFGTASAQPFTLSFWVKSSLTGTFGGIVGNDGNRTWAFTYTINSANTWEYKTISVTAQTGGSWDVTNGVGLSVLFSLACGSSYLTTPAQWSIGNYYGATGQSSVLATNGATWQLTGVQLEAGSAASPFENRLYTTELQLCQRYYSKCFEPNVAPQNGYGTNGPIRTLFAAYTTSDGWSTFLNYPTTMRAAPTITIYSGDSGATSGVPAYYDGGWTSVTSSSPNAGYTTGFNLYATKTSAWTAKQTYLFQVNWTASAEL